MVLLNRGLSYTPKNASLDSRKLAKEESRLTCIVEELINRVRILFRVCLLWGLF